MKMLSKLVWSEGMYLGPHHFQAQGRFFEDALNFLTESVWSDAHGFSSLQLDADQLRNGSVLIRHAKGLFPDGLAFDFPGSDDLLPARDFAALFPPAADHLTVYLTVPASSPEGRNSSLADTSSPFRYQAIFRPQVDESTGRDERLIKLGQKNLGLMAEEELTGAIIALPIVRIVRDGSGRYEADPTFVPPCLQLTASPQLTSILHRLTEILEDKSSVFSREQVSDKGGFQAGLSARQVSQFWFLHAINSSLPALRHCLLSSHAHPRELFREMLRLGGALCTFGFEVHPRSLPVYDHQNLGACFTALDDHIRRHIEIVMPSKAIIIPLVDSGNAIYLGDIRDERAVGPARWLLEVRARIGELDLIALVPARVKACSARFVPELVKRALPGMTLSHLPLPPPEIESRVDAQYFVINRTGPCWESILQTRQIGVHVPAEIPSPQLRLMIILSE